MEALWSLCNIAWHCFWRSFCILVWLYGPCLNSFCRCSESFGQTKPQIPFFWIETANCKHYRRFQIVYWMGLLTSCLGFSMAWILLHLVETGCCLLLSCPFLHPGCLELPRRCLRRALGKIWFERLEFKNYLLKLVFIQTFTFISTINF